MGRVLLVCLVVMACGLPKPPPQAPARHTQLGLSIKGVTLGNGLRVVLVNDPHASEVQVTMRYRVGAADDLEHAGIAHLVEHLMFQQLLGGQTLMAHLEDNATFHNAYTMYDATTYVSRARPEMLDRLLSIEAVRLGFRCTSITDSAFVREREVVTQEVKLRVDEDEMFDALHAAVFPTGHPYRQGIVGTVESVSAITREQACAFADAYYAPGNAALVISGNVSPERVEAALGKFLARIPKRVGPAVTQLAPARTMAVREVTAPLDDKVLLVSWPVPVDPYTQLAMRMIAEMAFAAIDNSVKGRVQFLELGDVRAPVVAVAIAPGTGETIDGVKKTVEKTLGALPNALGSRFIPQQIYDAARQRYIHAHYASLEDGSDRDMQLAEHVLAGRDPAAALAAEFKALRDFGRGEASGIAMKYLGYNAANVVTLVPATGKKRGRSVAMRAPTHDIGQRRSVPDPAVAREADTTAVIPSAKLETRVLPNGLKVVLMPLSSVPTVDIRLVFRAGSADDPVGKSGTALLAAHGLTYDVRHINDALSFMIAGGEVGGDVARDRTSFVVRGVDMHLDYLLAGLKRWVVDGRYDDTSEALVNAVTRVRKRLDDDHATSDAWNAALYGAQHPYARADSLRQLSTTLTVEDVEKFRRAYFTPDNATLVIAGRVDTALANRWVDFLFADWRGAAEQRRSQAPHSEPVSLARYEELTQMQVQLALPAGAASRAQQLVVAAMIDDIAQDVRHQLGAAYVFNALLDENRLASSIVLGGWIDPARASEVIQLLRDRIAKLREDPNAAARAFVTARKRVITVLASLTGSASLLASRAETDIALGREPLSDLDTAKQVQALTVDQLTPLFADVDLTRAAMLLRGPSEPVKAAFAVLGREPTVVRVDPTLADTLDEPDDATRAPTREGKSSREQILMFSEIEGALTEQDLAAKPAIEVNVSVNLTTASVSDLIPPGERMEVDGNHLGVMFVGQIGYRLMRRFSAGLHLGIGTLSGSYGKKASGIVYEQVPFDIVPVDVGVFAHVRPIEDGWAGFAIGVRYDGTRFDGDLTWDRGLGVAVEAGYDLLHVGDHTLAFLARAAVSYLNDVGLGSLSVGVAYRR